MKMNFTKGNQKTVVEQLSDGRYEITSSMYLTAYQSYGCKTRRTVNMSEGQEIMNRLMNKGFVLTRA